MHSITAPGTDASTGEIAWARFAHMHFTAAGKRSASVDEIDAVAAAYVDAPAGPYHEHRSEPGSGADGLGG